MLQTIMQSTCATGSTMFPFPADNMRSCFGRANNRDWENWPEECVAGGTVIKYISEADAALEPPKCTPVLLAILIRAQEEPKPTKNINFLAPCVHCCSRHSSIASSPIGLVCTHNKCTDAI